MWILLNNCFFSIVAKDCAKDELLVRARRRHDIRKVFPRAKVQSDAAADYRFRAKIKKSVIKAALAREVDRVTYRNFKDSVRDNRLHDAYLRVWAALAGLQRPSWLDRLYGRYAGVA